MSCGWKAAWALVSHNRTCLFFFKNRLPNSKKNWVGTGSTSQLAKDANRLYCVATGDLCSQITAVTPIHLNEVLRQQTRSARIARSLSSIHSIALQTADGIFQSLILFLFHLTAGEQDTFSRNVHFASTQRSHQPQQPERRGFRSRLQNAIVSIAHVAMATRDGQLIIKTENATAYHPAGRVFIAARRCGVACLLSSRVDRDHACPS